MKRRLTQDVQQARPGLLPPLQSAPSGAERALQNRRGKETVINEDLEDGPNPEWCLIRPCGREELTRSPALRICPVVLLHLFSELP